MPVLSALKQVSPVKMLLIGDSGTGKTGSLASLVKDGYNLRILDFDNGTKILQELLTPEEQSRVVVEQCQNEMAKVGEVIVPKNNKALPKAMSLLTHWKMPETKVKQADGSEVTFPAYDLGPVSSWTRKDVLVIDSLSLMGDAAMQHVLTLQGRAGTQPYQSDWGEAIRMLTQVVQLLYSDAVKCNVIVTSHIKFVGTDDKGFGGTGYPNALGQQLPATIGRYFNTVVRTKPKSPSSKELIISTVSADRVALKTESPLKVPAELPQATGMATLFKLLLN